MQSGRYEAWPVDDPTNSVVVDIDADGVVTESKGDARRAAIVRFISEHWAAKGYAPTVREIACGVGLKSMSTAYHHLVLLERTGRIMSTPSTRRSIRVMR